MTAPTPFCASHPFGTTTMCGPCRDRRRAMATGLTSPEQRYEQALQEYNLRPRNAAPEEQAYESALSAFWRGRSADAHLPGCDDDDSVTRFVGNVRLTVPDEGNEETSHPARVVGVDSAHALIQVVDPEVIRVGRVKVEDGSVVVQLDSHGRKRTARRVLTAVAVAGLALWVVAS